MTTVEEGTLRLNKTPGNNAVGGDIVREGGSLVWSQADQVADTASITANTGLVNLGNRPETLTNLTIHDGSVVDNFSGSNITGLLTVTAGAKHDAVNSNGNNTVNQAILSDTVLFLGANSGDSTDQLTLDGTITVSLTNGFQPLLNDTFDLFEFSAANASGFDLNADLILPALNPGLQWDRSNFLSEGILVVIPEPLSSSVLLTGLAYIAGLRRRRK